MVTTDPDGVINSDEFDIEGFRAHGFLWMLNKAVLHPRGYALALDQETGMFTLWGNGDEPWSFALSEEQENGLFNSFEALLATVTSK